VPWNPQEEYHARLTARRTAHDRLTRVDARCAHARVATFFSAVLLALLAWRSGFSPWLLIFPVVVFAWLVWYHARVLRSRELATRAIRFYEHGLARLDDRWVGTGETGERFRNDDHVYANDLDLFGHGSLFELLSIARTRTGEAHLAEWLLAPADAPEIQERQHAVEELAPELDLREQLALIGADVDRTVQTDRLIDWAGSAVPSGRTPDLDAVAHLLTHNERARFQSSRLVLLRSRLNDGGAASHIIRRLCRLADVHESQKNAAVFPAGLFLAGLYSGQDWLLALGGIVTGLLLLVRPHLALAVERWRRQHGPRVRLWIDAVAQFEALNSLACYRYERALDPFPEITPGPDGTALFDAVQLVHPLMPRATAVRNDVRLDDRVRLIVVSGSNMSGKSTLLRTVGTNVVLALAGGPVRAASLRLSPLALGATLRIQDSLLEGRSRFYAEITRIRTLVRIADGPLPLLFLLDELFHGTNSHDRLSGAQGVLRSLLARRAVGLITTHDLALTAIAAELAPHAVNVHFEDWFDDGAMKFDYRMRPGPVTRSNALALMRAVGLEVESGPEEARR
jgi:hypothetical protein